MLSTNVNKTKMTSLYVACDWYCMMLFFAGDERGAWKGAHCAETSPASKRKGIINKNNELILKWDIFPVYKKRKNCKMTRIASSVSFIMVEK